MSEKINIQNDETAKELRMHHRALAEATNTLENNIKRSEALRIILGKKFDSSLKYDLNVTPRKEDSYEADGVTRSEEIMSEDRAVKNHKSFTQEYKANLYDAREHLSANREMYETAAIKDANAAGHDVNLGGDQYPAQVSDQEEQKV